jgi:hypothetical protein
MTQPSLYEQLFALTTVMKQRVVDNFDGDTLDERWSTRDLYGGTGTYAMVDAVDEGFSLIMATDTDAAQIDFNDIRHYAYDASTVISVVRRVTDNCLTNTGFISDKTGGFFDYANYIDSTLGSTFKGLETSDSTNASFSASSVAEDTAWTGVKITCGVSDIRMFINGVLEVTKTTDRPTLKLQPMVYVQSNAAGTRETRVRYLEAYNI